ncbi:Hypothetical protein POVR1_LOCUS309 [uncultured virus]|nr:Hypothetical protein POVR1_LOCUS309 [uncultured virus]
MKAIQNEVIRSVEPSLQSRCGLSGEKQYDNLSIFTENNLLYNRFMNIQGSVDNASSDALNK